MKGKKASLKTRKKQSFAQSGNKNGMFGRKNKWGHHSKKAKKIISETHKGILNGNYNPDAFHGIKRCIAPDCNKIISRTSTRCKSHAAIEGIKKGKFDFKPNKPEIVLINLLNTLLPNNEYKYVGDGSFWIDKYNPDFIDINSKKIIEFNGCYWHRCIKCGFGTKILPKDSGRLRVYKKYGYNILIIWEHELKDMNKIKNRIINYVQLVPER
jgi:G:T-mismatch repair DNA endonuclease (very short patch repair protein)